jgi:ATP-dependent Lon protease
MVRLSALLTKYNIGAQTLIDFLITNGYEGELSFSKKIDLKFVDLIHNEFELDKIEKEISNEVKFTKSFYDFHLEEIKRLPVGCSKRLSIEKGAKFTYRHLFGDCFWGAERIVCIDPYVRQAHQFQNLLLLIELILQLSSNPISFQLLTCFNRNDKITKKEIEKELKDLKEKVDNENFNFSYSIETSSLYHDRSIYVDNKYIIDLSRGLDIFQKFDNVDALINKPCTVFITRLK